MQSTVLEYEKYALRVDQIRLQYYAQFTDWQKNLEKLRNFRERNTVVKQRNDSVFYVIEDCSLHLDISIKQKKAGQLLLT